MTDLVAPFPWFGGKSRVAAEVWAALGDVHNYTEPFAGSLAVLLARPESHAGSTETANDLDGYIANFWRSVQRAPAEVAQWANNPVNENDLTARHIWLVQNAPERLARLEGDPDYYDAKVAGWWVWGICCWIGSGWCSGNGPWTSVDGQRVHLGDAGRGVNRQRVHLGAGQGVNRKRVHLGDAGMGVNRGLDAITDYMEALAQRLRYVRVCCGDWRRVVTAGALSHGATAGIFLDPPYDQAVRSGGLYRHDAAGVATQVRQWCVENGDNPRYRIVLAGYENEDNDELLERGWSEFTWTAGRAYGQAHGETDNSANRQRERLFMSPSCHRDRQLGLF